MAGTTTKNTGSASAASPDLDVQPGQEHSGADRATRLRTLLEQVRSHSGRLTEAATRLVVEVDGVTVAITEGRVFRPRAFELPFDGRSLTVRDENGCSRAHLLLDDQSLDSLDYDGGRLAIAVERDGDARKMTLVLCCIDRSNPQSSHTNDAR